MNDQTHQLCQNRKNLTGAGGGRAGGMAVGVKATASASACD